MLGNFIFCISIFFFFIFFLKKKSQKIYREYHVFVKYFGSRPGLPFCHASSGFKLFAKVKILLSRIPGSIVQSVTYDYRCTSDCRSRGCEFVPGPVPSFHGG